MKTINANFKNLLRICVFPVVVIFIFVFVLIRSDIHDDQVYKANNLKENESVQYIDNTMNLHPVIVIAHRGVCANEPENSMSSIKSSIERKVDYAEIDVQETADGVVVLMHDPSLKRLTGVNAPVNRLTYKQMEKLTLRTPSGSKYKEDKIPTLDDVIKASNHKLKIIIEIKPYGNTVDLTRKVVNLIEENNFTNQCMVHSLSYKILLDVKRQNPNIRTGYIVGNSKEKIPTEGVDFYSIEQKIITPNLVNNIHKTNRLVYAWTVNYPVNMQKVMKSNVDGIITDKAPILLDKKNEKIHKI
ncbi:glycerophosphodiester phosphodiesterase [Clostridium pasteurianum]|uniref:glycerophosphodiester phosphodiesterase n=1 Tax=Clostridium pasteurianum TaxID=1501 RepID=UPI0003A590BA|nr:glycerophosphodiester phosphodiesterase [Clostridium pasteurianum]